MKAAFEVRGGSIESPEGTLLRNLSFTIPAGGVTVILGPAGCGKSKLLQALHNSLPERWHRRGEWLQHEGGTGHVAQSRARDTDWRSSIAGPGDLLLLDEIDRATPAEEHGELVERLRARAAQSTVVIVTHHLAFARALADHVILLCDGVIVEAGTASALFEDPQHPLARRFVEEGNCWPAPPEPVLPSHFHWLFPGQLAGMGKPGLLRAEDDDLFAIASAGITSLVSLTERPFPPATLRAFGIASRHFPIADMGVPPRAATARLCRSIEKTIEHGGAVAVHCLAGRGRTGTILAALLVWKGLPAADAVARVRATIDGAIQTAGQLAFLRDFEELERGAPPAG